jgi:hypothetical protein
VSVAIFTRTYGQDCHDSPSVCSSSIFFRACTAGLVCRECPEDAGTCVRKCLIGNGGYRFTIPLVLFIALINYTVFSSHVCPFINCSRSNLSKRNVMWKWGVGVGMLANVKVKISLLIITSLDLTFCLSLPCQNGGTCTNQQAGYTCTCPAGWTGVDCERGTLFNRSKSRCKLKFAR